MMYLPSPEYTTTIIRLTIEICRLYELSDAQILELFFAEMDKQS